MSKSVIFLVLGFLSFSSFASAGDDESVFIKRLQALTTGTDRKVTREAMVKFAEEFPDSQFADDALYVAAVHGGLDSLVSGDESESIRLLEKLISQYPEGKLETKTIEYYEKMRKMFGGILFLEYIPYKSELAYEKGMKALKEKQYNDALVNFLKIINSIEQSDERIKDFSYAAHRMTLVSYKRLDKQEEGLALKNKMIELFPDKAKEIEELWLRQLPK